MKTVKYLMIRVLMCSGMFLNATAQDDLVGLHLPQNLKPVDQLNCCDNESILVEDEVLVMNDLEISADADNSWIENKERVSITGLPAAIMKTLIEEYEVYAVLKAEEVETSVRKAYKVRILKDNEQWDILLNRKGTIILEEKISY